MKRLSYIQDARCLNVNHRRSATDMKRTERTPIPVICAISSGLHKHQFNSNNQICCDVCSKTLLQVHHWAQVLARDALILIAECADMVKYQTSSSTRLGPSYRVVKVTMLDTAYASGTEAHDNVTVSNFSISSRRNFQCCVAPHRNPQLIS